MNSAVPLTDDDFVNAPEGFRSAAAKNWMIGWVIALGIVFIVLQMVVPQVIMFWMQPQMSMFGMHRGAETIEADSAVVGSAGFSVAMSRALSPGGAKTLKHVSWDGQQVDATNITLPQSPLGIVRDGDVLWGVAMGCVSRIENGQVVNSYPSMALSDRSRPFLEGGQLSTLKRLSPGNWQKLVFDGNQWQVAGMVDLPADMVQAAMQTTGLPYGLLADSCHVVSDGKQLWTLYYSPGRLACRPGVWTTNAILPTDPVSALDLENGADSPWVQNLITLDRISGGLVQQGKLILLVGGAPRGVPKPFVVDELSLTDLKSERTMPVPGSYEQAKLLEDEQGEIHLLTTSWPFKEAEIHRLTGAGFQPQGIIAGTGMPGSPSSMLDFLFSPSYLVLSFFPWVLLLLMLIAFGGLMRRYRTFQYAFGHTAVRLAGLGKRALARLVDTLLYAFPMMAVFGWGLLNREVAKDSLEKAMASPIQMIQAFLIWGLVLGVYLLVWLLVFSVMEGVWGCSPGKYLCGLRVVRTTLEPLGVLRALVRQFLLVIDGLFNYTVGAVMVAIMPRQQRLGDLAADAIVVERSGELAALQSRLRARQ